MKKIYPYALMILFALFFIFIIVMVLTFSGGANINS